MFVGFRGRVRIRINKENYALLFKMCDLYALLFENV
jgi:hypothetical protein